MSDSEQEGIFDLTEIFDKEIAEGFLKIGLTCREHGIPALMAFCVASNGKQNEFRVGFLNPDFREVSEITDALEVLCPLYFSVNIPDDDNKDIIADDLLKAIHDSIEHIQEIEKRHKKKSTDKKLH